MADHVLPAAAEPDLLSSERRVSIASLARSQNDTELSQEYKVYIRRYFVLLSYGVSVAAWNLSGLRANSIVPSYAKYHDTTNQLSPPPLWGIDTFSLASNIVAIFSHLPASYCIDRWGLRCITIGSFLLSCCAWAWYISGRSTTLVVLCQAFSSAVGPLVSVSLLAISNRWFPPKERVKATAVGGLIGMIGAALGFIISPMYRTQKHEVVDLALRSCARQTVSKATVDAFNAALAKGEQLLCIDKHLNAKEQFCCYLPVDIPRLNRMNAIVSTFAFIFTAICVRNLPPTPPAPSGKQSGSSANLWNSLRHMFSNQRFTKLAISDFLVSGPPLVVVAAISRMFPAKVAHLSNLATMLGIVLAVPSTVLAGHFLDKTKAYWTFTFCGYLSGTVFWLVATFCMASRTIAGAYVFMGAVTLAMSSYICWQAAVFETKLEYVFEPQMPLEGVLVASDRVVINLSSLVFLAAIPPERFSRGAIVTFYIGLAVMAIGCVPTAIIRDKFRYKRLAFDTVKSPESSSSFITDVESFAEADKKDSEVGLS